MALFNRLTAEQVKDLITYLCEGNTKEELAELFIQNISDDRLQEVVHNVKGVYQQTGDYYHVGAMKVEGLND